MGDSGVWLRALMTNSTGFGRPNHAKLLYYPNLRRSCLLARCRTCVQLTLLH